MLLIRTSIASLLALGLSACAGCSEKGGATVDGGAPDAAGVRRPDASSAGDDDAAAPPDGDAAAAVDAGPFNAFIGQWDPIPGAPPSCAAAVTAADPAVSVGP